MVCVRVRVHTHAHMHVFWTPLMFKEQSCTYYAILQSSQRPTMKSHLFYLKKNLNLIYLLERETRERTQAGGVGEGEADLLLSREARCGTRSQNTGILT